jgi:hypothetical protein
MSTSRLFHDEEGPDKTSAFGLPQQQDRLVEDVIERV